MVVDGATGVVSERKLANHLPGRVLQPSLHTVSTAVANGTRVVEVTRPMQLGPSYLQDDYYAFDTALAELPIIAAVGTSSAFAYHRAKGVGAVRMLAAGGAPSCLCAGAPPPFGDTASGIITYTGLDGRNESLGFNKHCRPHCQLGEDGCTDSGELLEQRNPTCDVRTYAGGLRCCHHQWYLMDLNQTALIPPQELKYHMKMRFYFQEHKPAVHKELWRWHFATDAGSGEYDIPRCKAGTPAAQCVHTIETNITVRDFTVPSCNYRSGLNQLSPACKQGSPGFKPILAGGHCHAPSCLSMELWNRDTGELLCRNLPTYGHDRVTNASNASKFSEDGYLALPPCVWGEGAEGLAEAPLLTWGTNLTSIKRCNSTYGHTGEMALWQGRGVMA